jgi:branched-chain amino acid transport system ATP-binding protein
VLLRIEDLSSGYGRLRALHAVSLAVPERGLVAVIGRNGAGKSTLLRAISGVQPHEGRMYLNGSELTSAPARTRVAAGIAHVPEGRQVFADLSVQDNLMLGAYRSRKTLPGQLEKMYSLFPILHERRRTAAGALSGGQQQMLAVARALMAKPRLLLLDEPSMGLAPLVVQEIYRVIGQLKAEGTAILLVEQNALLALEIADRGYLLETGEVIAQGSPGELMSDPRLRAAYIGN